VRRLLTAIGAEFAGLGRTAARGWDAFAFTPADPTPLGLIRIAVGLLLLWSLGVTGLDLRASLGPDGWADADAVRTFLYHVPEGVDPADARAPWAWSFWFLVPGGLLPAAWGACLVGLALFTLGLGSRWTAPLAWAIAASTARRSPVLLFGFDNIVGTWALYLAVSGSSGRALALDRLLARRRGQVAGAGPPPPTPPPPTTPTVGANLGLRLIQLHLALIYGAAGLAKLRGEPWWDGTAMQLIVLSSEFRRFDLSWLLAYPGPLALATHGALALEILYPVLIWVRPLRAPVLLAAILMHAGIDLTLGLTEFGLAMLAGNLAFLPAGWLGVEHVRAIPRTAAPGAMLTSS